MIKLNRTTEYGLVALRHMSRKRLLDPKSVTSAREIAVCYGLPFENTAKTLLRLKDAGLIQSAQGARGGYTLRKDLNDVNLAEFLQLMEDRRTLVACSPAKNSARSGARSRAKCEYSQKCEMRALMSGLNERVTKFLSGIRLAELADCRAREDQEEEVPS